ncbi:hypothetical protein [Paenibacillus sp. P13VS]|uniref:hypothetical protein n=1 Tax=Paenibacillus sp. P13VS TaxID=2697367 RepID=UPI00187B35FA|nr:hypothetical protein [Paenibacillus sp. P13VS]MBE7683257.1 hypothetical protein [Paenibacillus sp. P13VS]
MDTKNLIAYSKVHEYILGDLPKTDTYDDRIISQKVAFLVQDVGIYLGEMDFFWHKRGPYSRSLAAALRFFNKNQEMFEESCENVRLNEYVIPKLDHLKNIINSRPSSCPKLYWLEICASLKYISKEEKNNDIDYLSSFLIKKKSFLLPYKNEIYLSWQLMN